MQLLMSMTGITKITTNVWGWHAIRVGVDQELTQNAHGQGMRDLTKVHLFEATGSHGRSEQFAMIGDFPMAL